MMRFIYTLGLLLMALSLPGQLERQLAEYSEMMKNKEYNGAIQGYQELLDEGYNSPQLSYNLGVAYFETGKIGSALLYFLKAEKAGMNSDQLKHNIELTREARIDEIEEITPFFLTRWWETWKGLFQSNIWSLLALLLIILGMSGWTMWRISMERSKRKRGFYTGLISIILSILCAITSVDINNDFEDPKNAVLTEPQSELMAAPDKDSAALMDIHEGVELKILDRLGSWVKVSLLNGQVGWVEESDLGYI